MQFFFALAINSMSLMMDCISMEIDVVTYLGNLYAEVKRQSHELSDLDKAKISLVFSGISIGILTGMTTYGLIDVISTLAGGRIKDDLHPAWYLIIFGGFGFLFDLICMYCFSIWGDPEEMGLGAKGAPAAADVEGGAPGAPDTMQPILRGARVDLRGLAFEGESRDGLVGLGRDVEEFDGFRRRSPDRDVLPFRVRGEVVQGRRLLVLAALAP